MKTSKKSLRLIVFTMTIVSIMMFPFAAGATHSWGSYHWARTANPFTLKVIDSTTADWDDNLDVAIADWHSSSVMNVVKEAGSDASNTRKRCPAVSGKIRVCNASYGNNGWLGLAQIWASGSHITQGTAKMNDSYMFTGSSYTETNRQHVMCQEIGHDFGLTHQDESGADLNTCMDYSNALDNPHPNAHDYAQLVTIYTHLDSSTTIAALPAPDGFANADVRAVEAWGTKVAESDDGLTALYVLDFGRGYKIFTFVFWAR